MEGFEQYAWQVWTALALVLGVLELFSLELFLLMLAAGAGVGVLTALLGAPVALQIIAALGTSVAMLALVRPNIVKRLHSGPELKLGHHALVGREAVAVSRIDGDVGQVRIGGELWSARAYDPTCVIPEGARVDVMQIEGATALVHEIPSLESGGA
jgi:membrane protein implicated in regulation of membrane protease activity